MTPTIGQLARNLLEAPLVLENAVDRLGRAIWLYVRLLTAASYRGTICRHVDALAADLGVSAEVIRDWLARLASARLVEVQTPAPYLVLKLSLWSDSSAPSVPSQQPSGAASAESNSYSFLHKSTAIAREDRGVGEGEDELLRDILETLDESDPAAFRPLLRHYQPGVIRTVLQRVRETPPERVKKSKTALFRFLLGKTNSPAAA